MSLFLVQHGRSLPKTVDAEQGLSPEGQADVERIAGTARAYGVRVAVIEHSGKKRTRQTAELFAAALVPPAGVVTLAGIKPLDDVLPLAGTLKSSDNRMLVGHLPFMEKLCACLVTGSTEKPVFRFQNGGIVCLEEDPDKGGWIIKWALMPQVN